MRSLAAHRLSLRLLPLYVELVSLLRIGQEPLEQPEGAWIEPFLVKKYGRRFIKHR